MSEREEVQNKLEQFLNEHSNSFTAPYGILTNLHPVKGGPGKVRTITFGVARYLDATIWIWSPKRIVVDGQGGLAYKVQGTYKSVDDALKALATLVHK